MHETCYWVELQVLNIKKKYLIWDTESNQRHKKAKSSAKEIKSWNQDLEKA